MTTVSAPSEKESSWSAYLCSVAGDERLTQPQRERALEIWKLIANTEPRVMYPTSGIDDEGCFYFAWNPRDGSLDIDIQRDGSIDWFFVDHRTGVNIDSDSAENAQVRRTGFLTFLPSFRRESAGIDALSEKELSLMAHVIRSPLARFSPEFHDAVEAAERSGVTVAEFLRWLKKRTLT